MKYSIPCRRWSLLLAVGASWFSTVAFAQTEMFSVKVLENLPRGTAEVAVDAINDAGEAVGTAGGGTSVCATECAVVWHAGVPTPLGTVKGATGYELLSINNSGEVAGTALVNNSGQAVIWNNGMPTLLTSPGPEYIETFAVSLNDAGQVVGNAQLGATGDGSVAVVWNGSTPTVLDLVAGYTAGFASGINSNSLVVGNVCCSGAQSEAVVWHGTTPTLLPKLKPTKNLGGQAVAVNTYSVIVGHATAKPNHALAWSQGVATDLGTLKTGERSAATALNDRGIIVGNSDTVSTGELHAALWSYVGAAPQDLNNLLSAGAQKQITLTAATGINDSCAIVANGFVKATSVNQAFLLTPIDASTCVKGGTL